MRGFGRPVTAALLMAGLPGTVLGAPAAAVPKASPAADACGNQAARYENAKGFKLLVLRSGEVRIDNPLRPLTPDVTRVLEVAVGGKRATVYGPDFASLRRGGPPGAMQASLGAPIRWEASLPALPDALGIVAEDGTVLSELSFRACEAPPSLAPDTVPQAGKKTGGSKQAADGKAKAGGARAAKAPAEPKTPPGFSLPQGAIAE